MKMELAHNIMVISAVNIGGKANPSLHNYAYLYDQLNRLTSGVSNEGFNEMIAYDNMGNIQSMNRNPMGTNTYSYSGNKLTAISGFVNSSYGYDGNGNQVSDSHKDITLNYNYLNLPQTISKASTSETMENTWLASGTKLRKVVGSLTRDYVAGIEYNNGSIEFIQTEEGRVGKDNAKIQARIDKGGLSEKKLSRLQDRLTDNNSQVRLLNQSISDIKAIGEAKETYTLASPSQSDGTHGVVKDSKGVIQIEGSNTGLHLHEIRHVGQSIGAGELSLIKIVDY